MICRTNAPAHGCATPHRPEDRQSRFRYLERSRPRCVVGSARSSDRGSLIRTFFYPRASLGETAPRASHYVGGSIPFAEQAKSGQLSYGTTEAVAWRAGIEG